MIHNNHQPLLKSQNDTQNEKNKIVWSLLEMNYPLLFQLTDWQVGQFGKWLIIRMLNLPAIFPIISVLQMLSFTNNHHPTLFISSEPYYDDCQS